MPAIPHGAVRTTKGPPASKRKKIRRETGSRERARGHRPPVSSGGNLGSNKLFTHPPFSVQLRPRSFFSGVLSLIHERLPRRLSRLGSTVIGSRCRISDCAVRWPRDGDNDDIYSVGNGDFGTSLFDRSSPGSHWRNTVEKSVTSFQVVFDGNYSGDNSEI